MRELNKEYRGINKATDVLSFNIDNDSNEVYICPSYIYKSYRGDSFRIEVLRMIVHGILHIYGHDHKGYFIENAKENEKMFTEQEKILNMISKKRWLL